MLQAYEREFEVVGRCARATTDDLQELEMYEINSREQVTVGPSLS